MVLRVISLLAVIALAASAQAQTAAEYQYIRALSAGDLAKARALLQLEAINPGNIAGKPVISHISNFGAPHVLSLPDPVYAYLTVELKQSLNAQFLKTERSVFSTFCAHMQGTPTDEQWTRNVRRIRAALATGASAKEWLGTGIRKLQPLPVCIEAYRVQNNPHRAQDMFDLIGAYLKAGANADYELYTGDRIVSMAASRYDAALMELLVKHGARIGPVFPPSSNSYCPRNAGKNTLLGQIPDPKDEDVARARDFLTAFIRLGGDIKAVQTQSNWAGSACIVGTLKQKAVGFGQVAYAQMVQGLETNAPSSPVTSTPAPSKPKGDRKAACGLAETQCSVACSRRQEELGFRTGECVNACGMAVKRCTETGEFYHIFTGDRRRVD